jgi:16S rRNA (guanine966-N2)-methyltransferase
MSMIQAKIPGARVLDPMAGSGALAIETLSRGAASALLADASKKAQNVIQDNIALVGAEATATFIRASQPKDFNLLLPHGPFDLLLLCPPYAEITLPKLFLVKAATEGLAAPAALAVWEQDAPTLATWDPEELQPWALVTTRAWGRRAVAIFSLD